MLEPEKLIFEKSVPERSSFYIKSEIDEPIKIRSKFLKTSLPKLPYISEVDFIRHYTNLSRLNFGVDNGFYPLGSCTMKYNPKVNEEVSKLAGFLKLHPFQELNTVQGLLKILYDFEKYLCEIVGFDAFTLQPCAGAHGELTAVLIAKKYFLDLNEPKRRKILIPDSSHGTNPASAVLCGFEILNVPSNSDGEVDFEYLRKTVNDDIAMMMLTLPNTLGLYDRNILKISELLKQYGILFYLDGANFNALIGKVKPTNFGFDIAHLNLHKTFSTPHGGGGPGSGPVGVVKKLEKYLPVPKITFDGKKYMFDYTNENSSIGKVSSFYGNISVILKAYAYLRILGRENLKSISENAVLNANYVLQKLRDYYYIPFNRTCMHEFVISAKVQKEKYGVKALDIAKRLIDYGFHPPTIYFPLIVEEALMIEPTETESKETLDRFIDAMIKIAIECEKNPDIVKNAPHTTVVKRLDEVKAVKELNICYKD